MVKTGKQVESDVRRLLLNSPLTSEVSGSVYRDGLRPRDSQLEDIVIIFSTGLPDQIQTGVVILNIYVPDIDPYGNGVFVEDGSRVEQLEAQAQAWVESLTTAVSCYRFRLQQTIYSEAEKEIQQHVIVVRLSYEYFGDGQPITIPKQDNSDDDTDTEGESDNLPSLECSEGSSDDVEPVIPTNNFQP